MLKSVIGGDLYGVSKMSTSRTFRGKRVYISSRGYPCLACVGGYVSIHEIVWEEANGSVPDGYLIHHTNGDKSDYRLENLELMTRAEHGLVHSKKARRRNNGVWEKLCCGCEDWFELEEMHVSGRCLGCEHKRRKAYQREYYWKTRERRLKYYRERYRRLKAASE